jgi:hypothetical protein
MMTQVANLRTMVQQVGFWILGFVLLAQSSSSIGAVHPVPVV